MSKSEISGQKITKSVALIVNPVTPFQDTDSFENK